MLFLTARQTEKPRSIGFKERKKLASFESSDDGNYVKQNIIFWDMTPCSQVQIYKCFGGKIFVQLQGARDFSVSHTLKFEIGFPETSVDFLCTTRCYIPQASTLQQKA
jgi:hypothetical protein